MKTRTLLIGSILMVAGGVHASPFYEVETRGLAGLDIESGKTLWQPAPAYPKMALRRDLEGEVTVEYSIDARGRAENINILESSPRGFFDGATVRALESASFGRAYEAGEPVAVHGLKKRFIYRIERVDDSSDRMASVSTLTPAQ